jgi:hypothetical protein
MKNNTRTALLALATIVGWSVTASAQLDPLTLIRRVPPTVIIVLDTSLAMLQDGSGNLYDPGFYSRTADPAVMGSFSGITSVTYRRIFKGFAYSSTGKYTATTITAVQATWDPSNPATLNAAADIAGYLAPTRYQIARTAIAQAVNENNSATARWGLIRLRQKTPSWRSTPGGATTGGNDCDKPVTVSDPLQIARGDTTPCNAGGVGKYATYIPKVGNGGASDASYAQSSAPAGTVMITPAANTASSIYTLVNRVPGDPAGIIPAGVGGVSGGVQFADRPLSYALDDAKAAAISSISADTAEMRACRNVIVVLITGGKDSGDSSYTSSNDVTARATQFASISGGGVTNKRIPIHVIGVKVPSTEEAQLQAVAANSGGAYHNVTTNAEVTAWINYAVQAGYGRKADLDAGRASEFAVASPIVGTVNLKGGKDVAGSSLVYDEVHLQNVPTNAILPQRSNVMITGAFELPGFYGRLRAFRVFKPQLDSTQPSGFKFVKDGTRLWPDLDGRPSLAGQARTPADPNSRNIYTYVPDGSGGGSLMAFTTANVSTLAAHMNLSAAEATTVISMVRAQPLGAIIGSTPALMDPPSLDPPPDDDYGRSDAATTFAGKHAGRRSLVFVGANDGMMHAIDARTGYEVWAFIPYNLLPKLRTLYDGQPVEQYEYFVDSSPKLAEVKLDPTNSDPALRWHSLLLFGQGPGGTFYQCFDVSEAGMGVDPTRDDISAVNDLLVTFNAPGKGITFKWAFPNYNHFDPTFKQTFTLSDGTAGGKLTLWGDLNSSATYAEKTVGFTWSDPAVGALNSGRTKTGVVVGSGYFPDIETLIPNRGASAPKAGGTLYLLDVTTGTPIGNASGASCATYSSSGTGCLQVGDVSNGRKNALQADPTAAGLSGSPVISKAFIGDIDGRYWRFTFNDTGAMSAMLMIDTAMPIYASSALLFVGSADLYTFFATGSDMLPPAASGGTGTYKLYGLKDNYPAAATTKFAISLATVSASGALVSGERPSTSPTVAGDIVFYTTTTENSGTPCADPTSSLRALTYIGTAAYDADGDGKISNNESNVAATATGRATAPFIVDQHLYFGTVDATGTNVQAFGDGQDFNNGVGQVGVRILSWREIR